jgi:small-conductance mechanosensitive channel
MESRALVIYLTVIAALGTLVLLRTIVFLRKSERIRMKQAKARRLFESVRTSSPIDNPQEALKEKALASIEARFTVTKRLLLPLVIIVTAILAGLPFLSMVPAALVSVIAAIITVGLGIAARPVVENAMAGLVISFSKLFRIGDTVMLDDWYGTIEDITITHTTMKVWDWRRYVLPNSQMIQAKFVNYTLFDAYIWAHVEFWVSFDADLDDVRDVAMSSASRSRHYSPHESPRFWVMEMGKEGIRCWIAAWADGPSDGWMLTHDIRTEMVREFRRRGIHSHGFHHHLDQGVPMGLDEDVLATQVDGRAVEPRDTSPGRRTPAPRDTSPGRSSRTPRPPGRPKGE